MKMPLEQSPTRIAFAGDWHGNYRYAVAAIDYAAERGAQGIVHLGDFGIWWGRQGDLFRHHVSAVLGEHGMWLGFVDGNHEDFELLAQMHEDNESDGPVEIVNNVTHLPRGTRWTWHGKTWLALGGATSLDRDRRREGIDWWPQEEITYAQAGAVINAGPADVMVAHDAPSHFTVPGLPPRSTWPPAALFRADQHRQMLKDVVDEVRPAQYWHGHFHSAYSTLSGGQDYSTVVMGLDCDGGPLVNNVMVVDLDAENPLPHQKPENLDTK